MSFSSALGHTDIYLIDQILKDRYRKTHIVLAAGVGGGRNLTWFLENKITIHGLDRSQESIELLQKRFPQLASRFQVASLLKIPFSDGHFDHIISSAVLHFAEDLDFFWHMFAEHLRVLKSGGTFFIRMASNIGLEKEVHHLRDGIYDIPDGTKRFLLTRALLRSMLDQYPVRLIEPLKTTNVDDQRCMSTMVMQKD